MGILEWYLVVVFLGAIVGYFTFNKEYHIHILVCFLPFAVLIPFCIVIFSDGDGCCDLMTREESFKKFEKLFENFGYQGIDDETRKQLKEAKEARNSAIEAAKLEYATKVSGLKKDGEKRILLKKLDVNLKDWEEFHKMLKSR